MMSMTHRTFDPQSHPRSAASGRFTEAQHSAPETTLAAENGDVAVTPVDERALRDADWQAQGRSEHAGEMMDANLPVGPEVEVSDDAARLFAEDALQNLPQNLPITQFPRLAEFANAPYTEAGGADPAKIDALHDELARIRAGHDYLAPHKHRRLDMLATFATHALPGQS